MHNKGTLNKLCYFYKRELQGSLKSYFLILKENVQNIAVDDENKHLILWAGN